MSLYVKYNNNYLGTKWYGTKRLGYEMSRNRTQYYPVAGRRASERAQLGLAYIYMSVVARLQAKLVLGQAAANVKIRGSRCLPVRA